MMNKLRWPLGACGCLILVLSASSSAAAQATEVDFKALYAAAEYDKALEVVGSLDTLEAQRYKALCLLALGRTADAGTAIESLVNASPTFIPSSEDAPPRFVELVTKARQKLLPTIARRVFIEGRERYNEKQNEEAVKRFSLVLTLLKDPAFTDLNAKQDLETLATGFIDLAKASSTPVKVVAATARTRTTAGGRPYGRSVRSAAEGRPARCSRADSSADADGYRVASGGEAGDGRADRCRRAGHIGNGEGVSAPALRSNRRARNA